MVPVTDLPLRCESLQLADSQMSDLPKYGIIDDKVKLDGTGGRGL